MVELFGPHQAGHRLPGHQLLLGVHARTQHLSIETTYHIRGIINYDNGEVTNNRNYIESKHYIPLS